MRPCRCRNPGRDHFCPYSWRCHRMRRAFILLVLFLTACEGSFIRPEDLGRKVEINKSYEARADCHSKQRMIADVQRWGAAKPLPPSFTQAVRKAVGETVLGPRRSIRRR